MPEWLKTMALSHSSHMGCNWTEGWSLTTQPKWAFPHIIDPCRLLSLVSAFEYLPRQTNLGGRLSTLASKHNRPPLNFPLCPDMPGNSPQSVGYTFFFECKRNLPSFSSYSDAFFEKIYIILSHTNLSLKDLAEFKPILQNSKNLRCSFFMSSKIFRYLK